MDFVIFLFSQVRQCFYNIIPYFSFHHPLHAFTDLVILERKHNQLLKYSAAVCSSLQKMFNIIFKKEDIPQQCLNGILININKGNCDPELFTNKRSISLKGIINKVLENILNTCAILTHFLFPKRKLVAG